jgi:hypothetical protein
MSPAPRVIASARGGALRPSQRVQFDVGSAETVLAVRVEIEFEPGVTGYDTEIVLRHEARAGVLMRSRESSERLATFSDDFVGERAGGTWTVEVRGRGGRPISARTFQITLLAAP